MKASRGYDDILYIFAVLRPSPDPRRFVSATARQTCISAKVQSQSLEFLLLMPSPDVYLGIDAAHGSLQLRFISAEPSYLIHQRHGIGPNLGRQIPCAIYSHVSIPYLSTHLGIFASLAAQVLSTWPSAQMDGIKNPLVR